MVDRMSRIKTGAALSILKNELADVGWDGASAFTVEERPRDEAGSLAWWHENTPPNERSETKRNLAYLRAYMKIAGCEALKARGIQLYRGRLWMDRSVISRLERDGYLSFTTEGVFEPEFQLTDLGRAWIQK